MLLDDGKEMVASHVKDPLASRHGHHRALYLENRETIDMANLKVIAGDRPSLFFDDESLCPIGDVSWEDADLMPRQPGWSLRLHD